MSQSTPVMFVRTGGVDIARYNIRGTVECKLIEPIGIASCAAYLRAQGIDARIYDLSLHPDETQAVTDILNQNPEIVGFSILYSHMMEDSSRLISLLRAYGYAGHITIGGTYPTLNAEEVLDRYPDINSVVRAEGEITMHDLVRAIRGDIALSNIQGLTFRQGGQIHSNEPRPLVEDLDSLPWSIRDDFETYVSYGGIIQIHASRGCHANCSFCSTAAFYRKAPGKKWRARSPQHTVDELAFLLLRSTTREVWFTDDNFIGPGSRGNERAHAIAKEIERRGLSIKFVIQSRADNIHRETIDALKHAGLRKVYIGVESGENRSLALYNKHVDAEQNARALQLLEAEHVFAELGFIGFHPHTTVEDIAENVAFLQRLCGTSEYIHPFAFDLLLPYRGTPVSRRLLEEGKAVESGLDYRSVLSDPRVQLASERADKLLHLLGPSTEHIKALIISDDGAEEARHCIRMKNQTMLYCLSHIAQDARNPFSPETLSDRDPFIGFVETAVHQLNKSIGI